MTNGLQQTIEFTIKNGKIVYNAEGFNGEGCEEATKFLRELGESELHRKPEHGGLTQRMLER